MRFGRRAKEEKRGQKRHREKASPRVAQDLLSCLMESANTCDQNGLRSDATESILRDIVSKRVIGLIQQRTLLVHTHIMNGTCAKERGVLSAPNGMPEERLYERHPRHTVSSEDENRVLGCVHGAARKESASERKLKN